MYQDDGLSGTIALADRPRQERVEQKREREHMKRDIELIVLILKFFEAREEVTVVQDLEIPEYDRNVVAYHVRRMYEGGLLDAETVVSKTTETRLINVLPFGLTWDGHEFLDAIRDNNVANNVRSRLGGKLADVPFVLIRELALVAAKAQLGLS